MTGGIFVDTNVLLYAVDLADRGKHASARAWLRMLWETNRGRLSFQVLQEFLANFERKWPTQRETGRAEVQDLFAWRPITMNQDILKAGWKLQDRYGFSFWDSLIVSAAKAGLCAYLLSEDFQFGQDIDGLRVIHPFKVRSQDV